MATKDQVMALHEQHPDWTARMIADELCCAPEQVHMAAKRFGFKLPSNDTTRSNRVSFAMRRTLWRELEAVAFEYAVPPNELAKHLIETIVNDNLFEAVIDKAPIAPNGFEQVGIPLNRALSKIAKGKPLDGERE